MSPRGCLGCAGPCSRAPACQRGEAGLRARPVAPAAQLEMRSPAVGVLCLQEPGLTADQKDERAKALKKIGKIFQVRELEFGFPIVSFPKWPAVLPAPWPAPLAATPRRLLHSD